MTKFSQQMSYSRERWWLLISAIYNNQININYIGLRL